MIGILQIMILGVIVACLFYICAAIVYLLRINAAAGAMMRYLRQNVGDTADWPIRIVADNEADADKLAKLITDLENKLIDYDQEVRV